MPLTRRPLVTRPGLNLLLHYIDRVLLILDTNRIFLFIHGVAVVKMLRLR
jgi:hypothetical protein